MGSFYFEDDDDEIKRKKDAAQNDFFARQSLFPQMEENLFADPFNMLGRIGGNIYAKHEISQPNDPAEQQADALASSVMQGDPQQSQDIISQPTTEISRQAECDAQETNPIVIGSEFDSISNIRNFHLYVPILAVYKWLLSKENQIFISGFVNYQVPRRLSLCLFLHLMKY